MAPGAIGFVRMDELVKKHPLYGQLAHFDADIAALQLKGAGPQVLAGGPAIAREEATLRRELDAAANRTRALLKSKQQDYQQRENAAISAALAASGTPGSSTGAIAGQMRTTYNAQASRVAQVAQSNLMQFRNQTVAQDESAVKSLRSALEARAREAFRARSDELAAKESAFSLKQANADANQRISLRTQLANLPLDDASRKDITDRLDALNRKEADALAALRNRDQAELVTLQTQLRARTQADFAKESAQIHGQTSAKLNARANQTRSDLLAQVGAPSGLDRTATAAVPANISPQLRARLLALHQQYQKSFQKDADQTVKAFLKTRDDLSKRFAQIRGVDGSAQAGARAQIDRLEKQRSDLYDSIVAQIGREVKLVAEKRSISVVLGDVVVPGSGVDLTADAEKDIESLHE